MIIPNVRSLDPVTYIWANFPIIPKPEVFGHLGRDNPTNILIEILNIYIYYIYIPGSPKPTSFKWMDVWLFPTISRS